MPETVLNTIVQVHKLSNLKDRTIQLQKRYFENLFTPAALDIALISRCDCSDCHRIWNDIAVE